MSNEITKHNGNELMVPNEKLKLLKDTICKGATDNELALFVEVCNRRGLDPFAKQIYAVRRKVKENEQWKEIMVFQTSIDGFRTIAERTGELDGQDGPYWCGRDGKWVDVWLTAEPPSAAKVTVYRKGRDRGWTGTARWESYVQMSRDGSPTKFWKQMPDLMLAKVAEALALRKAFPEDLSGLYTGDEMDQAGESHTVSVKTLPSGVPSTPKTLLAELKGEAPNQVEAALEIEPDGDDLDERFAWACEERGVSREAAAILLAEIKSKVQFQEAVKQDRKEAANRIIENLTNGKYDMALSRVTRKTAAPAAA